MVAEGEDFLEFEAAVPQLCCHYAQEGVGSAHLARLPAVHNRHLDPQLLQHRPEMLIGEGEVSVLRDIILASCWRPRAGGLGGFGG